MTRPLRSLLFAFVVLSLARDATAQRYHFRSFTPDEGLGSSFIWSIHQDRSGYLWFATSGGVSRYDGVEFRTFTSADGLRASTTWTIAESGDGHLWFGADNGISRFDGRAFRTYDEDDGVPRARVTSSAVDAAGRLWFGTRGAGLLMYDGAKFHRFTRSDGLLNDEIDEVFVDRRQQLWIGHRNHGVLLWKPSVDGAPREAPQVFHGKLGVGSVRQIAEDRAGNLYFGTRSDGVTRFDGSTFKRITTSSGIAGNNVYALTCTTAGKIVIATYDSGVSICNTPEVTNCRTLTTKHGLLADSIYAVREDREGNLWFGTRGGVSQLVTMELMSFGEVDGLPDQTVYSVLPEREGDIWMTTHAGVARLKRRGDAFEVETIVEALGGPLREVHDVVRDSLGHLWFASGRGLFRMTPDRAFLRLSEFDGLVGTYVNDLQIDRRSAIWIATSEGVSRIDPANPRHAIANFTVADGLPGRMIYTIAEDREGRIWVGTEGQGIAYFDRNRFHKVTEMEGLPSDAVHALVVARDGTLWMGAAGKGIARADPRSVIAGHGKWTAYGKPAGLRSEHVRSIVEREDGMLWLATNRGLDLFDPKRGMVVQHLEKDEGLAGNEASGANALAIESDGTLWFGSTAGATRYRPDGGSSSTPAPNLMLQRVTVDGGREVSSADGEVTISHRVKTIRFDYRVLTFRDPQSARYSYQLVGFDRSWSTETAQRFKEYNNVPPGDYVFRVRARVADQRWGPSVATFAFSIPPPFWESGWFRSLALIVIGGSIFAVHKVRTRHIRKRNLELQLLVEERTRELAQHSRELELRTRDLEAANVEILRANELKTAFLASMSHEVRTPLNSIIGFSEMLSERLRGVASEKELSFLQNVVESGHHLLDLINDLLDLSKIEAGKMEVHPRRIPVPPLIESMRRLLSGIATQRGIEIRAVMPSDLPVLFADEPKVRQILFNLLSNAVKFSPDNSSVEVEATVPDPEPDMIEIAVTDHGIGIAPSDQELVFQEFTQTRDGALRGGTGLGLAISRKLAELQGGRLSVESEGRAGSTFKLLLPIDVTDVSTSRVS